MQVSRNEKRIGIDTLLSVFHIVLIAKLESIVSEMN